MRIAQSAWILSQGRSSLTASFEAIVPPHVLALKPYEPGKPVAELERELGIRDAVKVASNENPLGPSPRALSALAEAVDKIHFYPDGGCHSLRLALASHLHVDPNSVIIGAGCDELIHLVVRAFCRPGIDEVLTHRYAFISYKLAAAAHNVPCVETGVSPTLRCDVDQLIAGMSEKTRVVFVANPNNPTGAHLSASELARVIEATPPTAIAVVDEAYHEYATAADPEYPSSQVLHQGRPLLLTLRTFSKLYGLAALRVGYAVGDERVVGILNRIRGPFNVGTLAQVAAIAALQDVDHVRKSLDLANHSISSLRSAAHALGLTAYPSLGNFVLIDTRRDATAVYQALLRRGIIVRPMAAWGLPQHLRVSIGTTAQTSRVIEALGHVLR